MDKRSFPQTRGAPNSVAERSARFLGTIDTPALHRDNPDGSSSKKVLGKLYTKPGEKPVIIAEVSRLAWVPEGIVFTPRTAAAPNGWGLPPTVDGIGTVGGDFPYVILNKYKHNNTPEYLHTVYSDTPVLGVDTLRMSLNWPALYTDDEDTVAWQSNRKLQQFMCRWLPILKEKKQATWFAHRPSVREFSFDTQEAAFIGINVVRADANIAAFSRPLRGWTPDVAQSTCNESVAGKAFAHDSLLFRIGWQTATERGSDRVGRTVYTLENLYANGNAVTGAALGAAAVMWWIDSPGHYSAMVNDYTDGKRLQYTTAGTAQLMAETISIGVTQKKNLGLSFTAREVATVKQSAYQRESVLTTWGHPKFGALSITGAAGYGGYFGTRNIGWPTKSSVSYKQVDILAVNNTVDFAVQRELLLGGGIEIKQTGDAMQESQWLKIVKEKKRREARYAAIRAKQSLPADNVCVDSEVGIELAQASWKLGLKTLSYEETGTAYASPATGGTVCEYVMRSGKLEDFIKTRTVIKRLVLPFNPIGISSGAQFSEDGTKAVVFATELLSDVSATWHGEKMHFYEFDGANATEIATSQIDITLTSGPTPISPTWTGQEATGQCKLFPYYDGNTLRWVDMKINHIGRSGTVLGSIAAFRQLKASLVFDDAFEWFYCDTLSGVDPLSADRSMSGVVKHILYLDLLHPERTHWVEFNFVTVTSGANETTCSAKIMRDMRSPTFVKTLYTDIAITTGSIFDVWLVPLFSNKSNNNPAFWNQIAHPERRTPAAPSADFKGAFWLGGGGLERPAGGAYATGDMATPKSTPLAPVVFGRSARFPDNLSDGILGDDYLVGGALYGQPFGFGKTGAPTNTWVYFKSSSLDLEAITGISGIQDNILPLWSL